MEGDIGDIADDNETHQTHNHSLQTSFRSAERVGDCVQKEDTVPPLGKISINSILRLSSALCRQRSSQLYSEVHEHASIPYRYRNRIQPKGGIKVDSNKRTCCRYPRSSQVNPRHVQSCRIQQVEVWMEYAQPHHWRLRSELGVFEWS